MVVLTKGTKAKTAKGSKPKATAAKKTASVKKPAVKKKPEIKKAAAKPVAKAPAAKKKADVKKPDPVKAKKVAPATKPVPVKAAPAKIVKTAPVKKAVPAKAVAPVKPVTPVIVPRTKVATTNVTILPPDYDPKKDKGAFMNPVMLEYFRQKLIRWREELLRESSETIQQTLQSTELQKPDLADRASAETDHALELRTRDRERKLITKINEALLRIEDGTYGYCEETGEPIGVARLDARPNATLSIEAQERHERLEKTRRDE
jgi:DnaK suppressor protein